MSNYDFITQQLRNLHEDLCERHQERREELREVIEASRYYIPDDDPAVQRVKMILESVTIAEEAIAKAITERCALGN